MSKHTLIPEGDNLYNWYPHQGDCTDTLCSACGCCIHCADDGHCDGAAGCLAQDCGCPEMAA